MIASKIVDKLHGTHHVIYKNEKREFPITLLLRHINRSEFFGVKEEPARIIKGQIMIENKLQREFLVPMLNVFLKEYDAESEDIKFISKTLEDVFNIGIDKIKDYIYPDWYLYSTYKLKDFMEIKLGSDYIGSMSDFATNHPLISYFPFLGHERILSPNEYLKSIGGSLTNGYNVIDEKRLTGQQQMILKIIRHLTGNDEDFIAEIIGSIYKNHNLTRLNSIYIKHIPTTKDLMTFEVSKRGIVKSSTTGEDEQFEVSSENIYKLEDTIFKLTVDRNLCVIPTDKDASGISRGITPEMLDRYLLPKDVKLISPKVNVDTILRFCIIGDDDYEKESDRIKLEGLKKISFGHIREINNPVISTSVRRLHFMLHGKGVSLDYMPDTLQSYYDVISDTPTYSKQVIPEKPPYLKSTKNKKLIDFINSSNTELTISRIFRDVTIKGFHHKSIRNYFRQIVQMDLMLTTIVPNIGNLDLHSSEENSFEDLRFIFETLFFIYTDYDEKNIDILKPTNKKKAIKTMMNILNGNLMYNAQTKLKG